MKSALVSILAAALVATASPLAQAAAASARAAHTAATPDDPVLAFYRGDGLDVRVTEIDEDAGTCAGTLSVDGGAAMAFTLAFTHDSRDREIGKGQVTTPSGTVAITTKERLGDRILVRFQSKNYTVKPEAAPGEKPRPSVPPVTTPATGQPGSAADARGPLVLSEHTFKDKGVGDMPSHTVLVPKGWKVEGGAFWAAQHYFSVMPSQDIRVTSPGGVSVHVEPNLVAKDFIPGGPYAVPRPQQGMSDKGYPVIYLPSDLDAWKALFEKELIPNSLEGESNVRVHNIVVIPELTHALGQACQPLVQMARQQNRSTAGMGSSNTVDWYVLGLETSYRIGGKDFEQLRLLAVTALFMDAELLGRQTMWTVERAVTFTAPEGQLQENMPVLKAVADSVRMTPEWFRMRADLEAKLLKIQRQVAADNLRSAQKRSEIIAQSGRDLNAIITGGYQARQAISDRTHAKVIQSIQETEEYVVPGGAESVQLPQGYRNVFSNGSGDYLLTNDEFFEPAREPELNGQAWTRMGVRQ